MGIEIGLISAAVGAASTVVSVIQQGKAQRAAREARAVQGASEEIKNRLSRRRAAREERIRRARLISGSVVAGAQGSSGQIGAQSALGANLGSQIANQTAETRAAQGISAALQRQENALGKARTAIGFSKAFSAFGEFGKEAGFFK